MPLPSLKYQASIILALYTAILGAQNLLKNPSFEQNIRCPDRLGNFHSDVYGWSSPTEASTDYFNTCSGTMGVPENFNGSQAADFGTAYAGLYLFAPNDYREYVQGELSETLVKGADYEISFYISLAERSDFAIREFGLVFSRQKIQLPVKKELSKMQLYRDRDNTYSFLKISHNGFLDHTDRWVHLKSQYTASGNEKFLTIGNFENNARTLTQRTSRNAKQGAYYYIDMVAILPAGGQPENDPGTETIAVAPTYTLETQHLFRNVLFGFDDYSLSTDAKQEIRKLFDYLMQHKDIRITISGHTDNVGSDSYNQGLAASRCKSVTTYLLQLGLSTERVQWESYGFGQPVADNTSEEGRQRNRRVAFSLSRTSTE